MGRLGVVVVAGVLALGVAGGCVFKGGRADAYRCRDGACPNGLECVAGVCVAVPDAGADATVPDGPPRDAAQSDGPLHSDGPLQSDAAQDDGPLQSDGPLQDDVLPQSDVLQSDVLPQSDAPPQQDAGTGCVFDPLTADSGHFTAALTSATWQYGGTGYAQTAANDLHFTWVAGTGGDQVSIQVVATPTAQGQSQFDSPGGNFASAAGVIVRASGLTATNATGYFCGVDLRGQRLLLGRMSGAYSVGNGVIDILGDAAMTVTLNSSYLVHAEASGSTITCTSGAQQVVRTDATIATGSVGLFTLGARALFTDALYCVP